MFFDIGLAFDDVVQRPKVHHHAVTTFALCKPADELHARKFAEMLSDDHGEHALM